MQQNVLTSLSLKPMNGEQSEALLERTPRAERNEQVRILRLLAQRGVLAQRDGIAAAQAHLLGLGATARRVREVAIKGSVLIHVRDSTCAMRVFRNASMSVFLSKSGAVIRIWSFFSHPPNSSSTGVDRRYERN